MTITGPLATEADPFDLTHDNAIIYELFRWSPANMDRTQLSLVSLMGITVYLTACQKKR